MTPAMPAMQMMLKRITGSTDAVLILFEEIISENTEPYDVLGVKRMSGSDIHKAFIEAAQSQLKWHRSEMEILDSLISLSHGFKVTDSL